jgi:hypothetical protein
MSSEVVQALLHAFDTIANEIRSELRAELGAEIQALRDQLPEWVPVEVAITITGLSATTLWRERRKPDSVIKSKQDHGLRYERASLLAYNKLRTQIRPRGRAQS